MGGTLSEFSESPEQVPGILILHQVCVSKEMLYEVCHEDATPS